MFVVVVSGGSVHGSVIEEVGLFAVKQIGLSPLMGGAAPLVVVFLIIISIIIVWVIIVIIILRSSARFVLLVLLLVVISIKTFSILTRN
jgi:hypothetical protein